MSVLRIAMACAMLAALAAVSANAGDPKGTAPAPRGTQAVFDEPVRLKAGDAFIDTSRYVAHTGPLLHDWDRDGKPDLLVGNFSGHVQTYRNKGTREAPAFEDAGLLKADGVPVKIPNW